MTGSGDPWQVETVWDLTEWQCAEVVVRDPAALAHGLCAGLPASQVIFEVEPDSERRLLACAALRGFPHLTLEMLQRLWKGEEVQVAGRRPTLLLEVLRPLCEWFLGAPSEAEWSTILARWDECGGRK